MVKTVTKTRYGNGDVFVEASKPSTKRTELHYYENNGHHDPSKIITTGGRNSNLSKGVLPENHVELFENSVSIGKNRYAVDSNNVVHQFQDSIDNTYHWAGSQRDVNIRGDALAPIKVKPAILKDLINQGLLER